MSTSPNTTRQVQATVQEVLPATGLAYAVDDRAQTWGITRCTQGAGIGQLNPGQRLQLTVTVHPDFEVVSDYAPLD